MEENKEDPVGSRADLSGVAKGVGRRRHTQRETVEFVPNAAAELPTQHGQGWRRAEHGQG
eukprot:5914365-Amphidinium_carterae.1